MSEETENEGAGAGEDAELIGAIKGMEEYEGPKGEDKAEDAAPVEPEVEPEVDAEEEKKADPEAEPDKEEKDGETDELDSRTVKVKIGEEEQEVTIGELKARYMRQADYTAKTQEAAGIRKAHQAAAAELAELVRWVGENLDTSRLMSEEKELERQLAGVDPRELDADGLAQYSRYKGHLENLKAANAEMRRTAEELKAVNEAKQKELRSALSATEAAKLLETRPEWKDGKKLKSDHERIVKYLSDAYGGEHARRMLDNVVDHRDYLTLHHAAVGKQYLTAPKPATVSKPEPPKAVRTDGARASQTGGEQGKGAQALKSLRARGRNAEATPAEMMAIIESRL